MEKFLKILRWIGVGFFAMMSFGALLSGGTGVIAAVLLAIGGLLIMPLPFVSGFRQRLKLNKVICVVLSISLFMIGTLLIPSSDDLDMMGDNSSSTSSVASNDETDMVESLIGVPSGTSSSNSNKPTSTPVSSQKTDSKISISSSRPLNQSSVVSSTIHSHSYAAATCTRPKTCLDCGATMGKEAGHSWIAATYTAPKTCSVCGATDGSALTAPNSENYHGHVYTGGSSSKKYHYEADCAGKNSHEITWDEVSRRNLGPCGTCVLK